jgi:hypothetical protein
VFDKNTILAIGMGKKLDVDNMPNLDISAAFIAACLITWA